MALELAIMALGAAGLMLKHLPLLLTALFLGGVQSTLFGPVKYAILPQHLRETELGGDLGRVPAADPRVMNHNIFRVPLLSFFFRTARRYRSCRRARTARRWNALTTRSRKRWRMARSSGYFRKDG